MKTIVVTGTDTDVGKTVFAAGLAATLGATYWKPIQAGTDGGGDSHGVRALGVKGVLPEAYRLNTPCSPHRAAQIDGVSIDPARLALPDGDEDLYIRRDRFRAQFAADVAPIEAAAMAATQRPVTLSALGEPSGAAAWKRLPSYVIYGSADRNIPAAVMAFMRAQGPRFRQS